MAPILLALLPLAVLVIVGALLWRRVDRLQHEIEALRAQLAAYDSAQDNTGAVRRRVRVGERLTPVDEPTQLAEQRSAPAQVLRIGKRARQADLSAMPDTIRGVVLALMGVAPALGLFFGGALGVVCAAGVAVGAMMLLLSLSRRWSAAAWAGVITAGMWAIVAFASGAAREAAALFASAVAFAGAAGLVQAFLARLAPGAALTAIGAAGALMLGAQIGLVSPAGLAFGVIMALSAMVGALNLRLEPIHMAAFVGALISLFVLSGQDSAAIWFTPAATWTGALFLGIAVIRVPELGARGLALAGTGVLAPLCAIAALSWSGHGLENPLAAAGAFAAVAVAISAIIYAAATRGARTLASLKATLWLLGGAAYSALAVALLLAAPTPIAASAFSALGLGLLLLHWRAPDAVWRTLAWISALLAAAHAAVSVLIILGETPAPYFTLAFGLAIPALLAGFSAYVAQREPAPATAGLFEALAIALSVIGLNIVLRLLASGGALLLTPISFTEAGLHVALWLTVSLLLATRRRIGAQSVRAFAVMMLGALALLASAAMTLLWLTPHWTVRAPPETASPLLQFVGLGFLAPALMFWAHWVLWRGLGANLRTRLSLGAGTLLLAAMATLMALQARDPSEAGPDWVGAIVGAVAFALAIGLNFANGVTMNPGAPRPSYFEENLQSHRRRQLRRYMR